MIPSVIASQVRFGLVDYLRATFPVETPFFRGILDRFFAEENQLFRGTYLRLRLPFQLRTVAPAKPTTAPLGNTSPTSDKSIRKTKKCLITLRIKEKSDYITPK